MSDKISFTSKISYTSVDNSENLYSILKDCVHHRSIDSLTDDLDCIAAVNDYSVFDCIKMVTLTDPFGDDILEENGRISLAYENLRSIPKQIAEKFANKTKFLDLSYNNFQNLSFLTFFDRLHTLILDRNPNLDVNSLPVLPNLMILWINNCEITKMDDWLYRIQDQCINLQQLSLMGNPGARSLHSGQQNEDYREYVFNMLPGLKYLDGVSRESTGKTANGVLKISSNTSTPDSTKKNMSSESAKKSKSKASLKFTELFRFNRGRISFQSSTKT